jgi:autotransporter-associated beta strand protein
MRLSLNSLWAAAAVTTFTAPAFAQLSPGPNPVTGPVTTAQTLSTGTGTVNSVGSIITSGGTTLSMTGTSTLVNNGTIQNTGTGRAIDSNSGVANLTVTNSGLISAVSSDAFRVNTDSAVSLVNSGTIQVTNGGQAIDWAAIKTAGNVLTNQATGRITAVGEDAVRMGIGGVVNNLGLISATPTGGADPSGSDGIDLRTLTGITVNNAGTIMGRHGIATDGSNAGPSTFTVNNVAGGLIAAINGSGLNIDGPNATVTATVFNDFGSTFKGGVLAGATDGDGDGIDVDGVLTLTNQGDILGLGARGTGNNAEGIAAGGGTLINTATGRIIGSSLVADAANSETGHGGNGILIDNSDGGSAIAATVITNYGLIQGKNGVGIQIVGSYADTITNNAGGSILGTGPTAVIQMGGGGDILLNRGAIKSEADPVTGQHGNAVDLGDGDDQFLIDGGAASIVGNVSGGAGNNTLKITAGTGSFAYSDKISNFNKVEVASGTATLSGENDYTGTTLVSGGRLVLDGANRIAAASALVLSSGALEVANAGGANGQTFASLELADSSTIDLDSTTSLTFAALSAVASGKSLSIVDWDAAASPEYAIRFIGDLTSSAAFLALMSQTTVNGAAAAWSFDGMYTDVKAVPVPAAFGLLMSGLGLIGAFRRRKTTTA